MKRSIRVLHLEDSPLDAELIQQELLQVEDLSCAIVLVTGREGFESALAQASFDLLLCDYNIPSYDGLSALVLARERQPGVPTIVISGVLDEAEAVACLKMGATDYVLKQRLERLVPAVRRALQEMEEHRRRLKAEQALRESEDRFRTMCDAAPVMIWMAGTDQRCIFFNRPWLEFTGRTLEQELNNGWSEGVHPEDLSYCLDAYAQAFDARQPFTLEYRLRRTDGEYRWILDNGVPRYTPAGEFAGYIGSCIDITERKRMEHAMERALQEKTVLLNEVHHRVKNNLQVIAGLLFLQGRNTGNAEVRAALEESQGRVKAMALIHQLLYECKDYSQVHLGDYLKRLGYLLSSTYGLASSRITLRIDTDEVITDLNLAIPCGLLVNELVSNCYKYAFPEGRAGEVCIELRHDALDSMARLLIRDNGVGLPARLDPKTAKTLGLQLVGQLAEQMRGTLRVGEGPGASFELRFSISGGVNHGSRQDPDR